MAVLTIGHPLHRLPRACDREISAATSQGIQGMTGASGPQGPPGGFDWARSVMGPG